MSGRLTKRRPTTRPARWASGSLESLAMLLARVRARHPERRVALSASSARIHGWAGETVFRAVDRVGALLAPSTGALCHVGLHGERVSLVDYGVSR